ncbi:MAG: hypothetical protein B6D36_04360 [Planctomycetes bacterium UTPLA1]|nr:MAG: hypothetical protein B6D36_04360 [Planctomycetes bacterium UTPLA1]
MRPSCSYLKCVGRLATITMLFSASPLLADDAEWSQWRGGKRFGVRADGATPTSWSDKDGLRWKTVVPGQGHSSPIVVADRVYVTTAYPSVQMAWVEQFFSYGLTALALLVGLVFVRIIIRSSQTNFPGYGIVSQVTTMAAFIGAACLIWFFVFFAPAAIDYERCVIRAWLGSSIMVGLCILLMEYHAAPGSIWRIVMGVAGLVFGVMVFIFSPSKDHAFRGGYFGASAIVVWASAAIPFLSGLASLVNYGMTRRLVSAEPQGIARSTMLRRSSYFYSFAVVVGLVISTVIGAKIVRQRPLPGEETSWGVRSVPMDELAIWMCGAIPIVFGLVLLMRSGIARTEQDSARWPVRRSLVVFASSLFVCAAGLMVAAFVLDSLVAKSPYLTYHLARPKWIPMNGWSTLIAVLAIMFAYAVYELVVLCRSAAARPIVPGTLKPLLLAVAIFTFVRVNFISNDVVYARAIVCLDSKTGETVWTTEGLYAPEGQLHKINSPATPTSCHHRQKLYSFFGCGGLMCIDLHGKLLWENKKVLFKSIYGVGVSLTANEDLLFVWRGLWNRPQLTAVDCNTGQVLWQELFDTNPKVAESGSSRTPVVDTINGQPTILVWDFVGLTGLDVTTGKKKWHHPIDYSFDGDLVASIVMDDDRIYCVGSKRTTALAKSKLGSTDDPEVWSVIVPSSNCSSPILTHGKLYAVTDGGVAVCLDTATGEKLWRDRLGGMHYASPVASGDYVYFTNDRGLTTILDATQSEFSVVAKCDIKSPTYASFAILPDSLIGRTEDFVFRVDGSKPFASRN